MHKIISRNKTANTTLHKLFYFECRRSQLPVVVPCTPRQLDAARERRGAPPADQGERGEESQLPQESESRIGWTPGGGPEREPRCHGRGLSSGNRAVKPALTASREGRCPVGLLEMEAAVGEPQEAACYVSGDPRSYYLLTVAF